MVLGECVTLPHHIQPFGGDQPRMKSKSDLMAVPCVLDPLSCFFSSRPCFRNHDYSKLVTPITTVAFPVNLKEMRLGSENLSYTLGSKYISNIDRVSSIFVQSSDIKIESPVMTTSQRTSNMYSQKNRAISHFSGLVTASMNQSIGTRVEKSIMY